MPTQIEAVRDAEVVRRAYQVLRPLLLSESAFGASVIAVTKRELSFTRARTVVERRWIARRSEPARARSGGEVEPLITPAFDPWQVEVHALPAATRQLCTCPECGGERRDCSACEGSGLIHTWLTVDRDQRVEVGASPMNVARHWLATSLDEEDFLRSEWLHHLEHEDVLGMERAHRELAEELRPKLDTHERMLQVVSQTFVVDAHEVKYQTAFGVGRIELAGSPLKEFDVQRAPLTRRNVIARWAVAGSALVSILAAAAVRIQHPWFEHYGRELHAMLLGLMASVLVGAALLGWFRAQPSRTILSTWCPTAGAVALIAIGSALLLSTQPSVADALDALQQRDLERAELTADVLESRGLPADQRATLLDAISLARIEAEPTLRGKLALAAQRSWSPVRSVELRQVLLSALEPYVEAARSRNDAPALAQLARLAEPSLPSASHALHVEAAALRNRACIEAKDLSCIEQSTGELGRLGAVALRDYGRQALVAIIQERFEHALQDVSHSRTARVELTHLRDALALSDKLDVLGAKVPRATRVVVERGVARAEAQVAAAEHTP